MSADGWRVHVAGPDDIHPEETRLEAMKRAHAINTVAIRFLEMNGDHPINPTVWASPVPPGVEP